MNRRQFLRTGAAGLGAAALGLAGQAGGSKPLRVGMIGCGWYGKSDLLRLIQVSPVEVVSLCDVDRRMLSEAAEVVSRAAGVPQKAAHLQRLSHDARREGPRYCPGGHAGPLARARHDRRREGRRACVLPEADLRGCGGRPGDARRRAQVQTRGADRHAAPQHAAPDRSARPHRARGEARQDRAGGNLLLLPHAQRDQSARYGAARVSRLQHVDRPRAHAPLQQHRASARLARLHGVWQRHRRRHVRPHARHDALDDGPRLAEAHRIERRHPGDPRAARRISPTRSLPPSTTATSRSSGSIAPGARSQTPSIPGAPLSTETRVRCGRA